MPSPSGGAAWERIRYRKRGRTQLPACVILQRISVQGKEYMGKEIIFKNVAEQSRFTLENQNGRTENFEDVDIEVYLEDMFDDPEQFVILTAPEPRHKVRYVQACVQDEGIEVELGIQEEGTRLLGRLCTEEECYRIFMDFYDNAFVPDLSEYRPVEF